MSNNSLIDALVDDLRPVRKRSPIRQAAALAVLGAAELAGFLALGVMRRDIASAVSTPAFWWKLSGLATLALAGVVIALRSFAPTSSPRRDMRGWGVLALLVVLVGGAVAAGQGQPGELVQRLDWRMGVECLVTMIGLSLPPLVALGLLMRSGAATDAEASAVAVGAGGATWGAFVFAFHCPSDDPFYIVFWYALSCVVVMLLARAVLPRLARW